MKIHYPPRIKEIIAPANFVEDLDLQQKLVDDRMTRDYVSVMFVCSLILIIVIIL